MIDYDPRRQDGTDRHAEESLEKTMSESTDLKFLIHMFNQTKNLIARIFGHWTRIDFKPDFTSHSAVWINGNRKFTFTAELIESHNDYPKDPDFIADHERIDERKGKISKRNKIARKYGQDLHE